MVCAELALISQPKNGARMTIRVSEKKTNNPVKNIQRAVSSTQFLSEESHKHYITGCIVGRLLTEKHHCKRPMT